MRDSLTWAVLALVMLSSTVAAAPVFDFEISDAFDMVGRELAELLGEKWALFLFVFIIWTWLLTLIVGIGLEKVPHIGKKGKMISFVIALFAVVSIMFKLNEAGGIDNILDTTLGKFGSILLIVLAIIGYRTFKGNESGNARGEFGKTSLILGIIMLFVGWRYMNDPLIAGFGALAVVASIVSWAGEPSARGSPYAHGNFSRGQRERWQSNARNTIHNLVEDFRKGAAKGRQFNEWLKNVFHSEEKEKQLDEVRSKMEHLTEEQINEIYGLLRQGNVNPSKILERIDRLMEYNRKIEESSEEIERISEKEKQDAIDAEYEFLKEKARGHTHFKDFKHEYIKNLTGDKLQEIGESVESLQSKLRKDLGKFIKENEEESRESKKAKKLAKKQMEAIKEIRNQVARRKRGEKMNMRKFKSSWNDLRKILVEFKKIHPDKMDETLLREMYNLEEKVTKHSQEALEGLSEEDKEIQEEVK